MQLSSRHHRTVVLSVGAVVALTAALVGSHVVRADSPSATRSFTISTDPTEPVVSITWTAGLTRDRGRYLLYGNGRFLHDSSTSAGALLGSFESMVPYEEVREVVALAVDHGVMDTDQRTIDNQVSTLSEKPGRNWLPPRDSGRTTIVISLTSYTRKGETTGPITKRFVFQAVKSLHRNFPELDQVAGLAKVSARVQEIALREEEDGPLTVPLAPTTPPTLTPHSRPTPRPTPHGRIPRKEHCQG